MKGIVGVGLEILGALGTVDGRHVNEFEPSDRCVWDIRMELQFEVEFMGGWLLAGFRGS